MPYRLFSIVLLVGLLVAACGQVAEDTQPEFAPTHTALPRATNVQDEAESETAADTGEVAAEPTEVPPTPVPTATLEPTVAPTEVPTEVPTPTLEPTEETAAEPAEAAASDEVVWNGYTGHPDDGDLWFNGAASVTYNGTSWECHICHDVNEPVPMNGPYLYGIATVAGDRIPGMSAIDYLANSILHPGDFKAPSQTGPDGVVHEWEDGLMPTNWDTVLDEQTIADIVAYLMQQAQERPE